MSNTILGRAAAFLKRQARAIRMARRGNMAMIFALSIIPVLVTGGAGIDLARSLAVRAKLYEAVDAAALAVASKSGITEAQAETLAQQYFDANYTLNGSFGTPASIDVEIEGQQVDVKTSIDMPTTIMGVVGIHNVSLSAASQVVWGQTKIWVGLALDNTGSMCEPSSQPCTNPGTNTKIYALKAATTSLLTMFQNASATPGDVQVSLIPFSRDVNVGSANSNATWLDWTKWDQTHPGQCYVNGSTTANPNYTTEAACNNAGTCTISGLPTSQSTESACTSASGSACSVNPSVNNTQTKCSNAGACSLSSFTTQSTCQAAGSCTLSAYTTQSTCVNAGTCTISGKTTKSTCESAYSGACSVSGYATQALCIAAGTCSVAGYTTKSTCQAAYNGYVCKINGVSYTDANHDTSAECTNTVNGKCSKPQFTTKATCTASKNPTGVWYVGSWTGVGGQGVWTPYVWANTYGVWTPTPGTWNWGAWTSANASWVTSYGVWTPAVTKTFTPNRSGWDGCIMDRGTIAGPTSSTSNSGFDLVNTTPGTTPESKFPTENYAQCPVQMTGLGYNWTALNNKVDAMVAQGNTNQTIGLAWAWQSLTQGNPLSPPSLPSGTVRHIILLSDGENTQNRWYSSRQSIDDRMHLLCNNAKNDDVIVWTVFVNVGGTAGNANSMKDCATGGANGGHYIEVTTSGGIGTAFNVIGQQITNMRVAH